MDLSELNTVESSNEGAVLEPIHPATGEKIGISITLAGADSERYTKAQRKNTDKRLKNMQKQQRNKMTSAEIEEENLELLAECTLSWENVIYQGDPLDCTKANAKMLYQALPWLKEQIDEFIGDRANFIKDS